MNDRDLFDLPPERDITPQLRAQVLHQALSTDTATSRGPRRPRRLLGPIAVGLGAAAVVLGVMVAVNQDDDASKSPPAAGGHKTDAPIVEPHDYDVVNMRVLTPDETHATRMACLAAYPVRRAGNVLSSQYTRGPIGPFLQLGYADRDRIDTTGQYFCTPFGVTPSTYADHLLSLDDPVQTIKDSRVQGMLAAGGPSDDVYFDGVWFAVGQGIAAIESRIVVGADAGVWHRTTRWPAGYMFASTWRTLTPKQAAGDVTVEYRALTTENRVLRIPGLTSTTVSPQQEGPLAIKVPALLPDS